MADTKTSALPAATVAAYANEFPINEAGTSKKLTNTLIHELYTKKGADVASAGTVTLGDGEYFHITGTTTITDIDFTTTWNGRRARLIFDGILTITHNATTLILPGGQNIITGPGDSCTVVVDSGDNVKLTQYERATGTEMTNPFKASTADQTVTAASTAYLTNSGILVPPSGWRVGSTVRWTMACSKTAAGTAARTILVKMGTLGTGSDATIVTLLMKAGTGVVDKAVMEVAVVCRGPLGASCIFSGSLWMGHNLATTGFSTTTNDVIQANSGSVQSGTAALIIGLALTTGSSEVVTFQQVIVESNDL